MLSSPLFAMYSPAVPHSAPVPSPSWQTADHLAPAPSPSVADWLFDQGSLTRRLTALAAGAFAVEPLVEGWQTLREEECQALDIAAGSPGWVREVYLRGEGRPWVFARSVAPRATLRASGLGLRELGERSLGELLFSDRAFDRGELRACRYPAAWLPDAVAEDGLWARRSRFVRGELAVLVAEVFLPALWGRAGPA